ncbi:uncharacterized protein [Montipora capricornis]
MESQENALHILREQLLDNYSAIYRSLKLHLAFHMGRNRALQHKKLKELHSLLYNDNPQELGKWELVPDIEYAIDPGSIVLEMFNIIVAQYGSTEPGAERGSKKHAEGVLEMAKEFFSSLKKNTFRPKVLAIVSRNGRWFVGSSMAVSHFLRPICLYNRVIKFNDRLKRAVVFAEHLQLPGDQEKGWSSSAFFVRDNQYNEMKPPCRNCQMVFEKLEGFIFFTSREEGPGTFLGACAEYCPVDEVIKSEPETTSTSRDHEMELRLRQHKDKCRILQAEYRDIVEKCFDAFASNDASELEAVSKEVKLKMHIFGFKPTVTM